MTNSVFINEDSESKNFSNSRSRQLLISLKEKSDQGEPIFAHWSMLPSKLGPNPQGGANGEYSTPWGLYAYRLDGRTLGALGISPHRHPHADINPLLGGKQTGFERQYVHIFKADLNNVMLLSDRYANYERDREYIINLLEKRTKQHQVETFNHDHTKTPEEAYEESYQEWVEKLTTINSDTKEMSAENIDMVASKMAEIAKNTQQRILDKPRAVAINWFEKMADGARKGSIFKNPAKNNGEIIYRVTREIAGGDKKWSLLLSKMGYDGVYDDGTASIYYGQEPNQLVLFGTRAVQKIGTFKSAGYENYGRVIRVENDSNLRSLQPIVEFVIKETRKELASWRKSLFKNPSRT